MSSIRLVYIWAREAAYALTAVGVSHRCPGWARCEAKDTVGPVCSVGMVCECGCREVGREGERGCAQRQGEKPCWPDSRCCGCACALLLCICTSRHTSHRVNGRNMWDYDVKCTEAATSVIGNTYCVNHRETYNSVATHTYTRTHARTHPPLSIIIHVYLLK